jgi:hypothetical protein
MGLSFKLIFSLIFALFFCTTVFACNIDLGSLTTDVRGTGSYSTEITEGRNQDIDIRMVFSIDDYEGDDCPTNITAKAIIYRYNEDTSLWETMKPTLQKQQELDMDEYSLVWSNEFSTGSMEKYSLFRIEGIVLKGSEELGSEEAYVEIEDNSCSGIIIDAGNITIDEARATTKTFVIENNTNEEFDITNLDVTFTSGIIQTGSTIDYDDYIPAHSSRTVTMEIDAGFVSGTTTTTMTVRLRGTLGSKTCTESDIEKETATITIRETGATDTDYSDNYSGSSSTDCKEIEILANDVSMEENAESKFVFGVKNDSGKRFEITGVKTTSNGIELSNYFNEKYIFSGQIGNLIVKAVAPSVTQNKIYENTIKIQGRFIDGKACSYDSIQKRTFNTTVNDIAQQPAQTNCSNFNIAANTVLKINNFGSLQVTITNNTGRKADIYLEGTVEAYPTVITLPTGTSISREITISMAQEQGILNLRPQVEGCNPGMITVTVLNTAKGSFKEVTIETKTTRDANTGALTITLEINNPTGKVMNAMLETSAPQGWVINDKAITINPGTTIVEVKAEPTSNAQQGKIELTLSANGEQITKEIDTREGTNAFTGLFAFGGITSSIGIILLIIIVIILVIGIIESRTSERNKIKQEWQEQ